MVFSGPLSFSNLGKTWFVYSSLASSSILKMLSDGIIAILVAGKFKTLFGIEDITAAPLTISGSGLWSV